MTPSERDALKALAEKVGRLRYRGDAPTLGEGVELADGVLSLLSDLAATEAYALAVWKGER
jgi:hypothetical protein